MKGSRLVAAVVLSLLGSAHTAGSAAAADGGSSALALEPIGGYTDLANVRVLTTALCPEQSTSLIVRISGAGFPPDTNVLGNTEIANVLRNPNRTGYVVPIFADWEYLASAHNARTPLDGPATLTLLCADSDLERIDARMEGALRFQSASGKRSTYAQEGGPRLATGLPGIPPPGNGGVPVNAPTARAAQTAPADDPQAQTVPSPNTVNSGSASGTAAPAAAAAPGTTGATTSTSVGESGDSVGGLSPDNPQQGSPDLQATGGQATSPGESGMPPAALAGVAVAAAAVFSALYLYVRRPRSDDPTTL